MGIFVIPTMGSAAVPVDILQGPGWHRQAGEGRPQRADDTDVQTSVSENALTWSLSGSDPGRTATGRRDGDPNTASASNPTTARESKPAGQNPSAGNNSVNTSARKSGATPEQVAAAEQHRRSEAERRAWLKVIDSVSFDQRFGVLNQMSDAPEYRINRISYDLQQSWPEQLAITQAYWARLNATTTPGPETIETEANAGPPQAVLETIWNWTYRTPVATPKPFVQAGRGIPGILTYLQTGMNLTINETVPSPAGPLQINGTATLTINWGDGEIQNGITNPGGPYPQGQLTHHYPNTGQYTITITANWLINYNLNGTTGTIPITTTGTLPNFPVTALRAVARPV